MKIYQNLGIIRSYSELICEVNISIKKIANLTKIFKIIAHLFLLDLGNVNNYNVYICT